MFVRCASKSVYHKDMCLKDIRLCAQNMITVIDFIINIIGRGHVGSFNEHENL